MRSTILAAAALLAATAFAQRTISTDSDLTRTIDPGKVVAGATVVVEGTGDGPNTVSVNWENTRNEPVAIVMERDLRDCIAGNLDRERLELRNGEVR